MESVYERFGREVKRVRKAQGLTQDELAQRVNGKLGRTSIVNIEKGAQRVHLHTVLDLAAALQVEPAELIPGRTEYSPEILAKAGSLPAPELDWVMRVTSSKRAWRSAQKAG